MSNRFRLEPVEEPPAPAEADAVGALLATNPSWLGPFLVFLAGLNFNSVPSMTSGVVLLEGATGHDSRVRELLMAFDDLYQEVRDGLDLASVHGHMLERYVWHSLGSRFPDRLGACRLMRDGAPESAYVLDAGTGSEVPAAVIEAKTTDRALLGRASQRPARAAKATWVVGLCSLTGGVVAGVFATWQEEDRFRLALTKLVGQPIAGDALIVGHEQLAQLPARLDALVRRLRATATA